MTLMPAMPLAGSAEGKPCSRPDYGLFVARCAQGRAEYALGDFPIKREGSQGQNKTYLVALKLAQFDFLKRTGTTVPLLLLDDIFDKLDASRVEQIIKLVAGDSFGQIFITEYQPRTPGPYSA